MSENAHKEAKDRADGFVTQVAKSGLVWGLKNDVGLATWKFDDAGGSLIPFWSDEGSAKQAGAASFPGYSAFKIKLADFVNFYLSALEKQKLLVGVQFAPDMTGIDMRPSELSERLKA